MSIFGLHTIRISDILIYILLYIYIYNPVFVWPGFGLLAIIVVISFILLCINFKVFQSYFFIYRKALWFIVLSPLYIYLIYSFNGNDGLPVALDIIKSNFINVVVPIFLVRYIIQYRRDFVFFDVLLNVGLIAAIISCIALFFPPFNTFLRNIMTDAELDIGLTAKQLEFRSFGLSVMLVSAYGYLQGIFAAYCILKADKKHKFYFFLFFVFFISQIINARTGILPIALAILYKVYKSVVKLNLFRLASFFLIFLLAFISIEWVLSQIPDVNQFVENFFDQLVIMFIEGGVEDTPYIWMLHVPDSFIGLLFGEGRSLFYEALGYNSDIGYVNQLFMGGVVFVSCIIIFEFIMYSDIKRRSKDSVFSTIFFISILVFNYKGVLMYTTTPYTRLWVLYYFVLAHNVLSTDRKIRIYK